jgi:hypothetical protein
LVRARWLSFFLLVTACGGAQGSSATPASATAAADVSGEWAVRWNRGATGWKPAFFNGTLDVWQDDGAWRASLQFRESVSTLTFASMTVDGDKVLIVFRGTNESKAESDLEIKGSMHDGKIEAEAHWDPVPWAQLGGYRTSKTVPTAKPVDTSGISGTVLNPDGTPAPGADVTVVAGDMRDHALADRTGHFTVHSPAAGDALLYAYAQGRSVRLQGAFDSTKSVTLNLAEPGTIEGTFAGAGSSAGAWLAPAKIAAPLPGIWGLKATVTGDHFKFEHVPAGDVEVHLAVVGVPATAAHALVHVEPGATATVTLDPKEATASVNGTVLSAATHQEVGCEAFLLLLTGRTAGGRVLLLAARGFKPRRVPVTLEVGKGADVGEVLLEPASAPPGK